MSRSIKRILYTLTFIVVLLGGLLFFAKNNQTLEFNYIVDTVELPFSLVMLASLGLGVVLGLLATVPLILQLHHRNASLKKRIKKTEKEVDNLRVLPMKDPHQF